MNLHRRLVSATLLAAALVLSMPGPGPAVAREYQTAAPSPLQSWVPNGRVYDILTVGDTVYIGGTFTRVRNPVTGRRVDRARLAAFDRVTGQIKDWDPGANDRVRSLAAGPGGVVFVGGIFTRAGGAPNVNVAAIGPDGTSLPGFGSAPNGEVRDVLYDSGKLFVAGRFSRVDGVARVGLAKVDAVSGQLDRDFNARLGHGRAFTLEVAPAGLLAGGNFKTVNRQPHQFLAAFDVRSGARSAWAPATVCDSCALLDMVVDPSGNRVYAAVAGGGGGRVASWSLSGDERLWVRRGDGDVQAIDVHDGIVYAGGHFGPEFDGADRHQLVALDTEGTLLPMTVPFTGRDAPGVWAVDAESDFLRIGGGFQGIEYSAAARYAVFPGVWGDAAP